MSSPTKTRFAHGRPFGAVLATTLLATGTLAALAASPAQADLAGMSSVLNANGFPESYTDTHGVTLDMCLAPLDATGAGPCIADSIPPGDGEAFYYSASAGVGDVTGALDLEAAWLDTTTRIVFQRTQYDAAPGAFLPGETYTITDPYGSLTCVGNENTASRTRCRFESGGGPNVFTDAVTGRIGPFLISTAAPAGFVGDNLTPTTVTGSPTGFNKFQVAGPGIEADGSCGAECMSTDQWVVQGRFAGPPPAPVARAVANPAVLDLGSQPIGSGPSAVKQVTVVSNGTIALTGITPSTGSAEFPVTHDCPASLAPSDTCTVSVRFDPSASGVRSGTLTIASNGATQSVPLSGRGTVGVMSLGPSPLDFGAAAIGSTLSRVVTLRNTGDAAMTFGSAVLSGADAGSFGLGGAASPRCVGGTTLAVGDFCQIGVTFAPATTGARSAALSVTSEGTSLLVGLTGTGVTRQQADSIRPVLASRSPRAGARGVSRRANVDVVFSEAVRGVDKATFRLKDLTLGGTIKARVVKVGSSGSTWRLDPATRLAAGRKYRVMLIGGPGAIRDLAGNPLSSMGWRFTTRR